MANKSFKISGQLDVSNIIANTEKLKKALKSSLDATSFQKIEKEFDKLAQAQAAYQQAMKSSFSNQSDVKAANKAIADFQKTYAKLSTVVQATLDTKGINLPSDIAKRLSDERKAIEDEQQRIAKAAKEWKTQIQNTLASSSLSKGDQQALARSIFSEEEFKKQIERIKKESTKAFSDIRTEIEGKKADLTSKTGEISGYTDEQRRQTFLSAAQQAEYGKIQTKRTSKQSILTQQQADLEQLQKEYDSTQKAYEERINALKRLEAAVRQENLLAAQADQAEKQYRQQNPLATVRNNDVLARLHKQTQSRKADARAAQARLDAFAQGDTSKSLEASRKKSEQELESLKSSITSLQAEIESLDQQVDTLDQMAETRATGRLSEIAQQLEALEQRLNEVNAEESAQNQELENIETEYGNAPSTAEDTEALQQREQALNEQEEAARRAAAQNSGLSESLEETSEAIRENTEESQKNVDEMDELIDSQNKVNQAFENMKGSIKTFLSIGSAITGLRRVLQDTFNDVKELDKSFANIAMVTDYSVGQMWESYGQYAEMANQLGQSTKSVIEASGLFYQQGLNTAESLALTKDTMKLATLAGLDFSEATAQMTAALRGFKMEMDEGARVTDVYSELAAKAAADVEGISYAMTKTASIAESAGMAFETTSAFLTQMIETTQEAPENIGTAMKTIIARFTELKTNVAGTADSEFDDLDYNKVDTALKSVGVSIKNANGQFRNLDEVFLELSSKWSTLDRNTQRYIATIAAGSRQQSRFIAMMDNYDRTIELVDTAYNSAGKSSEQFAKYQDTLEYKLNKLQNTWEQFRTSFFDSDFFKNIINGLNGILGKITELSGSELIGFSLAFITLGKTLVTNLISTVQGGMSKLGEVIHSGINKAWGGINNTKSLQIQVDVRKTKIEQLKQELVRLEEDKIELDSNEDKVMQDLRKIEEYIEKVKQEGRNIDFGTAVTELDMNPSDANLAGMRANQRDELDQQIRNTRERLDDEVSLLGDAQQQIKEAEERGQVLGQTLATTISTTMIAVTTSENPMAAFGSVVVSGILGLIPQISAAITTAGSVFTAAFWTSTAGIGIIISGIVGLIAGLSVAFKNISAEKEANKLTNQIDALNDKIEETEEKIQQTKSSLDELNQTGDTLEDLKEKWEKLGAKQTLTTKEQEEYNSLVEQIKDEYPELITYYDEENNKIQISLRLLDEKIEKQNKLIEKEQELLNLQQRQLTSQTYDKNKKEAYKDLTKEGRLLEFYSADMTEEQFESIFKGLSGEFITNLDYDYQMGHNVATQFFEKRFLEQYSDEYMTGKASEIAADYMRVTEVARNKGLSVEDVFKLDTKTLNKYLSEAGYGEYVEVESGEFQLNAAKQTESIQDNIDALKEFNEQVVNATTAIKQVELENFKDQANLNAEIVAQKMGVDANSAAATIVGAQAAAISAEMNKVSLKEADNGIASGLNDLEEAMGEYADDIELSVSDFKSLSEGVIQGHWAGANWSNISSSQRDNLELLGIDADIWKDEYQDLSDSEISTKLAEAYSDYAQNAITAIIGEGQEEKAQELNEAFTGLYSEIPQMTINALNEKKEEFQKQYGEGLNDEQWGQIWDEMTNEDVLLAARDNLVASGLETKIIDSLSTASIEYFSGMIDNLSLGEVGRIDLTSAVEQISKNYDLSNKELETLLSIDLSQGYHEIQRNSETYVNALVNAGMNLAEATSAFNDYMSDLGSVLGNAILGQEGASVINEMLQADIKSFKEQNELLIEARDEMLNNAGSIGSETYFSLIEAGFEDYVEITSNGYELITKKAEEAWTTQAMAPLDQLRKDIELNKQLFREAEKIDIPQINDAISIYLEYGKEFRNELSQLTNEQKRYIETIVAAGYATEEEYIKALQEGTSTLQNMEPKVWIQGLVNLQEASIDAAEKVNDLKKELADLNEQLIEDQKAVNEAAQALHEAKHGTEDFQSGLDGLINYERPLELINKQLENLKKNLNDVSNVDEAGEAIKQITGLYEDKMSTLQAESKVIDQSLANIRQELLDNYGNYVSFDDNGIMSVDFSYQDIDDSDIIKTEGLEALIEEYNSTYDMALDKEQEYLDAQKEFDELKSEARDKYISMEQNVIDVIKEQMQEEIDAVTEKYDALEEADNNYLDALQEAIDKQRELREQENQYEDLATKEKKLALMQRDTSGANRKETMSLEKEIEDNRQNLLDNETDNLIDSMKELYEKQKEARDLEIEAMEAATENMQLINETALNIISGFSNAEDYQAWLLENDVSVQDMTVAQTEQYLEEAKETFAGYAQYAALTAQEIALRTDVINQKADEMFTNTSENITNIGTVIQDTAEQAKQDAIDDATEAHNEAVKKMNETQDKIAETRQALQDAEDAAVLAHSAAMDEMIKASESGLLEVSTFAAKSLIEFSGLDLSSSEEVKKFAEDNNFVNKDTGEYSQSFVNALADKGYDTSAMIVDKQWQITGTPKGGGPTIYLPGSFNTRAEAEAILSEYIRKYGGTLDYISVTSIANSERKGAYKKYAKGGLVDYTGPAWVDGTPNKPESFLNSEDTARIGEAAKLLADLPIFNSTSNAENAVSTNIGDTSIEIHINVESISDDYDVDQMIERVKQDIVDVAKPIGTSVILNK